MKTESRAVPVNKSWPYCPFRGIPHIKLDHRCPPVFSMTEVEFETEVKGEALEETEEVDDTPKKRGRPRKYAESSIKSIPVHFPVMEEDTYCWKCVHEGIREREDGRDVKKIRQPNVAGKKKFVVVGLILLSFAAGYLLADWNDHGSVYSCTPTCKKVQHYGTFF